MHSKLKQKQNDLTRIQHVQLHIPCLENSAEMVEICYNMVEISQKLKLNDSPKSFQNQPSSAKQYDQLEPLDGCSKAVGKVGQWADRREKLDK